MKGKEGKASTAAPRLITACCLVGRGTLSGVNGDNILMCEADDLYLLNYFQDEVAKVTFAVTVEHLDFSF